jgi:phosphonopyruvate decarboxylase
VLDGDGALWMRLGSLGTVGHQKPRNFVHIVADNGSYASTGGQPTPAAGFDFARVALAMGYAQAADCLSADGLSSALDWCREHMAEGPVFLRVQVVSDTGAFGERPTLNPAELARLFRAAADEGQP